MTREPPHTSLEAVDRLTILRVDKETVCVGDPFLIGPLQAGLQGREIAPDGSPLFPQPRVRPSVVENPERAELELVNLHPYLPGLASLSGITAEGCRRVPRPQQLFLLVTP